MPQMRTEVTNTILLKFGLMYILKNLRAINWYESEGFLKEMISSQK